MWQIRRVIVPLFNDNQIPRLQRGDNNLVFSNGRDALVEGPEDTDLLVLAEFRSPLPVSGNIVFRISGLAEGNYCCA